MTPKVNPLVNWPHPGKEMSSASTEMSMLLIFSQKQSLLGLHYCIQRLANSNENDKGIVTNYVPLTSHGSYCR